MEKKCNRCKKIKSVAEFPLTKVGSVQTHKKPENAWKTICKKCVNSYYQQRFESDPAFRIQRRDAWNDYKRRNPYIPKSARARYLRRTYGMSVGEYDILLLKQGGVCAICSVAPTKTSVLFVDHDHTTGKVRGLLCRWCNTGIGQLNDDPILLEVAMNYTMISDGDF